jgi:hypothetical protein
VGWFEVERSIYGNGWSFRAALRLLSDCEQPEVPGSLHEETKPEDTLLSITTAGQEFETCDLQPIWPDPALNGTVM